MATDDSDAGNDGNSADNCGGSSLHTSGDDAGEPSIPGSSRLVDHDASSSQLLPRARPSKVVSPVPAPPPSLAVPSSRAASAARAWSDDSQDATTTEDEDEDHRRLEAAPVALALDLARDLDLDPGKSRNNANSSSSVPRQQNISGSAALGDMKAKKGAMKKVVNLANGMKEKEKENGKENGKDKENAMPHATTETPTQWTSHLDKWHQQSENVLTPRGSQRKQQQKNKNTKTQEQLFSSPGRPVAPPRFVLQPLASSKNVLHKIQQNPGDASISIQMEDPALVQRIDPALLPPPPSTVRHSTSLKSSAMRMMERSPLLRPLQSLENDPEWGSLVLQEPSPDLKTEFMTLCELTYPVIFTYVLEFLPGIVSMALVGHMDSPQTKEFVDGVSLSTMFMNLTGMAFGFGLATAMDTLCSQAFGAGKPRKMGIYFQCGMLVLGITLVPVFLLNWYTEQFLLWMGQPQEVAALAGRFSRLILPGIPFLYAYELFKKLLQAQNVVTPMVYIAVLSNVVNVLLGVYLTWYTPLGFDGAAVARTVANMVLPLALVPLFYWHPEIVHQWWPGWKLTQAVAYMKTFLTLGIPGMFMMLLEWWAFEIMAAFVGLLPDSIVAMSVHSVLSNVSCMTFNVFLGIGVATNIRVGTYVGMNQPDHAKLASALGMVLSLLVSAVLALGILLTRNVLPMVFINDATSVQLAAHAFLFLIPYQMLDSLNSVMQGVFRGTGRQQLGAVINLFGYFVVGLPFGIFLAFRWGYGVEGLWLGLTTGVGVGVALSLYKIYHVDWDEMADAARVRTS